MKKQVISGDIAELRLIADELISKGNILSAMADRIEGISRTDKKTSAIISSICEYYDLSFDDVMSRKRNSVVAEARQVVYFAMNVYSHLNCYEIGRRICRTQGAVKWGIEQIESRIQTEKGFAKKWTEIMEKINNHLATAIKL